MMREGLVVKRPNVFVLNQFLGKQFSSQERAPASISKHNILWLKKFTKVSLISFRVTLTTLLLFVSFTILDHLFSSLFHYPNSKTWVNKQSWINGHHH
jgi:hypothetical protein